MNESLRKRLLLITPEFPFPPITGGRIRQYELIKRTSKDFQITLVTPEPSECESLAQLQSYVHELITYPLDLVKTSYLRRLLSTEPEIVRRFGNSQLEALLYGLSLNQDFDIVQIEQLHFAQYVKVFRPDLRTLLSLHDVQSVRQYREAVARKGNPVRFLYGLSEAFKLYRYERKMLQAFADIVTVSDLDASLVRKRNRDQNIHVIPNGVNVRPSARNVHSGRQTNRLLFIGSMGYPPNIDAVRWFTRSILPAIRRHKPEIEFWIVGKDGHEFVGELANDAYVHVTGTVDNVRPYIESAAVVVIPLRIGSGTKLKTLEAMGFGKPIVATSVACEGIEVVDDQDVLIANNEVDFCNKILRIMEDVELRERLSRNCRTAIKQYNWDTIYDKLKSVYIGF